MIPKIIHYCWFGKTKKDQLILDCISSWQLVLPEYRFIEWNEKNTALTHPFVKKAYSKKKWAFVSDYIRLEKLYLYGGIYLDTDMLLIKNIDCFLLDECFFGAEDQELISAGIIGSLPQNKFIKTVIDYYDTLAFEEEKTTLITLPSILTKLFREQNDFKPSFESIVKFNAVKIYPLEYFYPLSFYQKKDRVNYKKYLKKNTYAVHLWSSSWIELSEFDYLRDKQYLKGLKKVKNKILKERKINFQYLKKVASCIKQSFN